jgi:hypothetical protein
VIPETLTVLGRTYKVFVGRCDDDLKQEGCWGRVRHALLEVDLRGDIAPENQREALWHEMLHCVDHLLLGGEPLEERETHVLSNGLLLALRQNRALIEAILAT